MRGLSRKLTYANVMATVAVFIALGGSSYAALKLPKNSVGSKQIKAGAVASSEVKNRSLLGGDFKAGQVLSPATADAKFLPKGAQAISADKLDGIDSGAFARGVIAGRSVALQSPATGVATREHSIPGLGAVTFECSTGVLDMAFVNRSGRTLRVAYALTSAATAPDGTVLGLAQANPLAGGPTESIKASWTIGTDVDGGPAATLEAYAAATRPASGPTSCRGAFTAVVAP